MRPLPAALIVAALGAAALTGACGNGDEPERPGPRATREPSLGAPRDLRLGFGAAPADETREAWIAAFAAAARHAEIIRIARVPPWEEFLPGAEPSAETHALMRLERALVEQYGLTLLFAIDPTDGAVRRARAAGLPEALDGDDGGFLREEVRDALVAYAIYVAANYEPDYLALGVEINMLRARAPDQFAGFVEAYRRAWEAVKSVSPRTKVFPTFQLEDMDATLGGAHPPQWDALDAFAGMMDALAVSTFPFLTGIRSAEEVGAGYYARLRERFAGEILISGAGYASAPVEGRALAGTQRDQRRFVERLLAEAETSGLRAVVWAAPRDPATPGEGAAAVLNDTGLRDGDGEDKLAWEAWREWARRPLAADADAE